MNCHGVAVTHLYSATALTAGLSYSFILGHLALTGLAWLIMDLLATAAAASSAAAVDAGSPPVQSDAHTTNT
jgi:hypothetical protein